MIADAVQFGDLLLLSGRAAVDPATLSVIDGGFEAQAQRVLDDIDAVLAAAGSTRSQVLRVECFLADAADFPRLERGLERLLHAAAPGPHHDRLRVRGARHPDRAPGDRRPRRWRRMSGRVVVVGGGIAGLCCAYYLRRRDYDVTIVESNRVGSGASFANGGWLCPAQAGPLPAPGLTLYGMRALFDRDSRALLQARRVEPPDALDPAVLDVLQRARLRPGDGRDRAARPRRVRPDRGHAGRRRRVRAAQAGHGLRRAQRRRRARRAAQPGADARVRLRPARRRDHGLRAARARAGALRRR